MYLHLTEKKYYDYTAWDIKQSVSHQVILLHYSFSVDQ